MLLIDDDEEDDDDEHNDTNVDDKCGFWLYLMCTSQNFQFPPLYFCTNVYIVAAYYLYEYLANISAPIVFIYVEKNLMRVACRLGLYLIVS